VYATIRKVPAEYPTIQKAINAANSGDIIEVAAGTYPEYVLVNKTVKLRGDNRASIITGIGYPPLIVNVTVNDVEISSFTIRDGGGTRSGIFLEPPFGGTLRYGNITNNCFNNTYQAIVLSYSIRVSITKNMFDHNYYAIRLHDSDANTIANNTIKNSMYWGFDLYSHSDYNIISSNEMPGNKYCTLLTWSDSNTIELNKITSSTEYGIRLSYSKSNLIKCNEIKNNKYGVIIWNCSGNTFYYNNFISNTNQVYHYEVTPPLDKANTWDDSNYPPGARGNYWSDYTGKDDGTGIGRFGEPRIAGDGIGDTLVPHLSVDWYPLMHPWTPVPREEPVAIFTYYPPEPIKNQITTFNASQSYDTDGIIISYKWEFGDGTVTTTDPIINHTYTVAGTFMVNLTVTDNDLLTNSTSQVITVLPFKLMIDVYTQQPDPYSGKGPKMPSDAFAPQSKVILYAFVTYNYEPIEYKSVAFIVDDPDGINFSRSNSTNEFGIAMVNFTLPSNAKFGIYNVLARVEVSGRIANDTLTFRVGWIIEIVGLEMVDQYGNPKSDFTKGEDTYFNIDLQNIAFTTRRARITISMLDDVYQTIGATNLWVEVPPGLHQYNLVFTMKIPGWSLVGGATTIACAFTIMGDPYCPEKQAFFQVMAS
jgi:parallel beta-helix repeat protein